MKRYAWMVALGWFFLVYGANGSVTSSPVFKGPNARQNCIQTAKSVLETAPTGTTIPACYQTDGFIEFLQLP